MLCWARTILKISGARVRAELVRGGAPELVAVQLCYFHPKLLTKRDFTLDPTISNNQRIMMNAMAGLPAALGGQLGLGMSHQALSHQLSQLSAFGISGGRSRMPDAHVEMLLDCYKMVQEERTLDSGRLGKGAFHQITEQLNKRTVANYCKDQVTAKLQNLKAQFRQRRAAVEAGHGEMRDWKWYDRMAEIMSTESNGKQDDNNTSSASYSDFNSDRTRKSPPSQSSPVVQPPTQVPTSVFGNNLHHAAALNPNLSKILANLPPQLRENPAALAQLMNSSNPLFSGLHNSPLPNPTILSHAMSQVAGLPTPQQQATVTTESDDDLEDNKNNVFQQQQAAFQRNLMARVHAGSSFPQPHFSATNKSPETTSLKRAAPDSSESPDLKRARVSPPPTSIPNLPGVNPALEGAIANLMAQNGANRVASPLVPNVTDIVAEMTTAKKDYLNGLRNLAFQLFTGLSAVLTQMEPVNQNETELSAAPMMPPSPKQERVSPGALETSTPIKADVSQIRAELTIEEEPVESENSKVSEITPVEAE
ncbi:Oidioi.mRNA.OKI2018_I69.XSR.g15886.t2.cds [Oikopleura dioica]|uniref:Oidioi.mRNA.OKI2018_I69.XSR.g15886.t2.cds n=1 Tax=Oikopleura dioica TaxID=34765 RepID=A0ABN7SEU1_OIKDI|nr:Oidioi.mRNA.OKI2018_I69.XSR.g15886.t2.cds [Oikopleura dioica]